MTWFLGGSFIQKCFTKELQKRALSGTSYGAGYLKKRNKTTWVDICITLYPETLTLKYISGNQSIYVTVFL